MSDQEKRLICCFASVFPALTADEIQTASIESMGLWDSLSTVTLIAVIQEEFDVEVDPKTLPYLDSFQAFRDYLFSSPSVD
jgi:acyl carrier protein